MRKNIFKTVFIAAAALAFASCSKDATTDLGPSHELSGLTKTITVTTAFESETRTALNDHELTWVEGDTFGIITAAADGTILENIESPKYEKGAAEYTLEVAAETETLYCYYPYSASYDSLQDIADFSINIPNFYSNDSTYSSFGHYDEAYAGEFLPQYHYMAAKAELSGNEKVAIIFTPLVSILEFNLYDTTQSGEKFTTFYFTGGGISKTAGEFTVNFDEKTLAASSAEDGLGIAFTNDKALSLPGTKENGTKLYFIIPKGEYSAAAFQVGSVDHVFSPSNGYFNALEWQNGTSFTSDGYTINIDLKHAMPAPLAQPLSFTQVEGNPFFATVPVVVQEACNFLAIRVYDTSAYNNQKNQRNEAGKNQFDEMVEQLYDAYITEFIGNGNSSKISTYGYVPSSFYPLEGYYDESITDPTSGPRTLMITEDWQLLYDGYWNSETEKWDRPGHRNVLQPNNSYTFVAYAKASPAYASKYGTDFVVYETEFTTPALEFNGTGTLETEYTQAGGTATVKVTGTGIDKLVYWIVKPAENKPKDPLTGNDLIDALKNRSGVYFRDFDGEYTFTQEDMNPGEEYIICVVGVDGDGKLVAAEQVKAAATDIALDGYAISDVKLASQPTKLGEVELTLTVEDSPKYLRIYTGVPRQIDGAAKTDTSDEVPAQTWTQIQSYFKNNSYSANYAEVEVTGRTVTTKISFAENAQILPEGKYDYEDNPGHNPIYILIVGADAKGKAITKLGNIYQITGEYDAPKVEKCAEDIHRGVKVGDKSHTVTDPTAYFYSCPVEDFGEEEKNPEQGGDYWDKANTNINLFLTGGTRNLLVYKNSGATVKEAWVFRLATGVADDAFSYANLAASRLIYTPMIQAAFSDYSDENLNPNSSVQVLKHYAEKDIPASYTLATPYVPDDIAVGDIYVVVGRDENNKLFGKMNLITKVNGSGFNGTQTTLW